MDKSKLSESYLNSAATYSKLAAKEERLLFILSIVRLIAFFGGISLIWLSFTLNVLAGVFFIMMVVASFLFLLKLYWLHSEKSIFLNNLSKINKDEAKAVSGDYSAFEPGNAYIDTTHDFSYDIDIFGSSSLFQFLNRTVTGMGRDILAGWLSDPFPLSSHLHIRNEAVREMRDKVGWRHQFMALGLDKQLERSDITGLLEWMTDKSQKRSSKIRVVLMYLLPAVSIVFLGMTISGFMHYSYFILSFLINLFYISSDLKNTNRIHNLLSRKFNYLSSIDKLLQVFHDEVFESEILKNIKQSISGTESSASSSIKNLGRLIQSFDSRMNIMVSVVLNGILLWDFHCVYRLERWKAEYCDCFEGWLELVGEVDAFISLGNYSYNNPDFEFPELSSGEVPFSAKKMGHILIDENSRVYNDFEVEKRASISIITGANMAGKSTFLRTVAINYVLAMIGAPVCASALVFLPSNLFTSMRTTDSLSKNESYFYAELKRLKSLKERVESKEPVFFILDEILKGTNSADKSLGSGLFMEILIKNGGTGLIATHDTSLGKLEEAYPDKVKNLCFEVEIDGDEIKFDYRLHRGITQKMNAALLMRQMGILD